MCEKEIFLLTLRGKEIYMDTVGEVEEEEEEEARCCLFFPSRVNH